MNFKFLTACAAALFVFGSAAAQEGEFDLASQRSESQHFARVPGEKVDHKGLVINPTPHRMDVDPAARLDIAGGLTLKDRSGKFAGDLGFVTLVPKKGVALTVDFGAKAAAKAGVKEVSGAYRLSIGARGIVVTGYDERGAFYGLQTLRQVVAAPASRQGLPHMEIEDWPDLPWRGVVEGFYGEPWSHEVRLSLIDFYGRNKMNCYLYGPKDDPYHSCPNWREPYPEREAKNIRELVEACNRNRVDFVWAIHPGQDIKWNEEDYNNLVAKFNMMYDFGVRSFAIFFDDISGEGTNPVRQTELLNRLNVDFVQSKGDISPLVVCPTDYSRLWANPSPKGSLAIYGQTLDPSINVFWTGDVVCSDLTRETLDWVNSRIQRPAYFWWNFPVTDYCRPIIMQGPTYGLDTTLTDKELCGLVSNPMEHGEASKLALYSVADYTWNIARYNAIDSWERALVELTPEAADAYRTFAIHNCDTETGYRRDESWETETFRVADFTDAQYDALMAEFRRVEAVPATMEAQCRNALLMKELRPWLAEFSKLGARGRRTLELIRTYQSGDRAAFWNGYAANLMSEEDHAAYEAHKTGTMKLQPFYERAMDDMVYDFFTRLTGTLPTSYRPIGSYRNLATTQSKLMLDNDPATFYTSGNSQKTGDWIGLDLGCVRDLEQVRIIQGRNSVDDVDYFDHARLECSVDGREWTVLLDDLQQQYEIEWSGEPVKARYVRLYKLESKKTNWAAVRSFEVNPVRAERLGFTVEAADAARALAAFDSHPGTSYPNEGVLAFGVAEGVKGYTLLMKRAGRVVVRQKAADGRVLAETAPENHYCEVALAEGAVRVELEGPAELFEIVPMR